MKKTIAYCGLNCETCDARIATVRDDAALREKTAKLWSELNGAVITPEMIRCTGCRTEGAKTLFCESMCPIRPCARSRGVETCGGCPEAPTCEKLERIAGNSEEARRNLGIEKKPQGGRTA